MNPPFSELNSWIDKLLEEMQAKRIQVGLVIVPSNRIGELWYHQLISAYPHAVMKEKVNYDRLVDGKRTVAGRSNFVTCLVTVSQEHLCSSPQRCCLLTYVSKITMMKQTICHSLRERPGGD